MLTIKQVTSIDQLDGVRRLMRSFVEWHYDRHASYRDLIDRYFDPVAFEAELAGLPGSFVPPRGRLLVAQDDLDVIGCVALRDLDDDTCEMKRMFVDAKHHGRGIGNALGRRIVSDARDIGYHVMRLDTGPLQNEAQRLYEQLGFRRIEPYYPLDEEMKSWLVFMELDLAN